MTLSLMKHELKFTITFGFGLQSSEMIRPYLVAMCNQKEMCLLWLNASYNLLLDNG